MSEKKNVETTDMTVASGYAALANTDMQNYITPSL
jgi:hypothetical protein